MCCQASPLPSRNVRESKLPVVIENSRTVPLQTTTFEFEVDAAAVVSKRVSSVTDGLRGRSASSSSRKKAASGCAGGTACIAKVLNKRSSIQESSAPGKMFFLELCTVANASFFQYLSATHGTPISDNQMQSCEPGSIAPPSMPCVCSAFLAANRVKFLMTGSRSWHAPEAIQDERARMIALYLASRPGSLAMPETH